MSRTPSTKITPLRRGAGVAVGLVHQVLLRHGSGGAGAQPSLRIVGIAAAEP